MFAGCVYYASLSALYLYHSRFKVSDSYFVQGIAIYISAWASKLLIFTLVGKFEGLKSEISYSTDLTPLFIYSRNELSLNIL